MSNSSPTTRSANGFSSCESIKDREAKRREEDDAAHAEEVDKFKKINEQLKANLEAMLSAPQRS